MIPKPEFPRQGRGQKVPASKSTEGNAPTLGDEYSKSKAEGLVIAAQGWRLCFLPFCEEGDVLPEFANRFWARTWLQALAKDQLKMAVVRTALIRHTSAPVARMLDEEVLSCLADLLARRHWHVHAIPLPKPQGSAPTESEGAAAPFPLAERRPSSQPSAPRRTSAPDDPPTFHPDVDMVVQAGTLLAAAAQGSPFCPM